MGGDQYLASEDSALLREALGAYSGRSCLEIGAGNGGNLIRLLDRFEIVVGTDLVRPSMMDWSPGADFVMSDETSCMRDSSFDLVAFNPPYLREEGTGDRTVEGGKGLEVPMRFLRGALRTVNEGGKVVMLLNDQADMADVERECSRAGFALRKVVSRRVFFEELAVYEASRLAPRASARFGVAKESALDRHVGG